MAEKQMNAVLRLRKDSENNFSRSNIILQNGEVAIISTPFNGTKVKIGDGQHRFNELSYDTFGLLVEGFKNSDTEFVYSDNSTIVDPQSHLLFLDRNTGFMFYWNNIQEKYLYVNKNEIATSETAGIAKIYDNIRGQNTDGSVTQAALNTSFTIVKFSSNNLLFIIKSFFKKKLDAYLSSLFALQILY